jgi:hypothetical protein
MKQLDLILCAVAIVIGIVGSWIVWSMRKPADQAPSVKTIDTTRVGLPDIQPVMAPQLPGAQGGAMGRGGSGRGGGKFGSLG